MQDAAVVPNRRERLREVTLTEIKETARRALVDEGVEGISLRAIARSMGMTAPALYRYFASRDELVTDLVADLYDEVSAEMERARDAEPATDVGRRLIAVSRAFRSWALGHPREFGLVFASPLPGYGEQRDGRGAEAWDRFGSVFLGLFVDLWTQRPFPVPSDEELEPRLAGLLREGQPPESPLPLGAMAVFLQCWVRLYGAVTMEVFGHLAWAVADGEPLFERELVLLGELLDLPRQDAGRRITG